LNLRKGKAKVEQKKLIEFKNIVKSFDGQIVLKGVDLDIYENEFVTLLGPSGCGKTTLLRILGGFLDADEGQVIFDGTRQEFKDAPHLEEQLFGQPLPPRTFVPCPSMKWFPLSEDYSDEIPKGFQNEAALVFHDITFSYDQDAFTAERMLFKESLFDKFSLAVEAGRLTTDGAFWLRQVYLDGDCCWPASQSGWFCI